jgi:predicted Zn-dependent protease
VVALALAFVLGLPSWPAPAQVRLPALGDDGDEAITVGGERRLGEQIMREIRRDPAYLDDPMLLAYAQAMWQPLVAAARRRGDIAPDIDAHFAWEIFLVRDRSFNAFALPGGFVGVHLGLIAAASSTDELASVLAHELSHVTQRHIARGAAASSRQGMLSMAALILGMLAASRSNNPDVAQAAIAGGQALMIQGQLNFSRDMEREADRIGYGIFADAGFAPAGMASMFDKMDNASRLSDSGSFPYLRTHPLTLDRLAEARSRLPLGAPTDAPRSAMHELMRARAAVLMEPHVMALQRHAGEGVAARGEPRTAGRLYAAALAASLLNEPARADAAYAELRRDVAIAGDPNTGAVVTLLRAELLIARGDGAAAARELASLPPTVKARPELFLRTQAALRAAEAGADLRAELRELTQRLQSWVALNKRDAFAWELLARCNEALGAKVRALRAQAEARAAIGDLGGAIERMRVAQNAARSEQPPDYVEASVIDARMRELIGQRRQLAAETRPQRGGSPEPELRTHEPALR